MTSTPDKDETPSPHTEIAQQHAPTDTSWFGRLSLRNRILIGLALVIAISTSFVLGRMTGNEEPAQGGTTPTEHAHVSSEEATTWTCSMHPQIQSPEPGTCPICGMDLIPATDSSAGAELSPTQVRLTPRAMALARIRTQPVKTSLVTGTSRTLFGQVVEDEEALRAVTSWIAGRVDRLHVSTTGTRVKRGQKLATLYSPEVYAAHQDVLVAREQLERLEGADAYAQRSAQAQLDSARQRLSLLGFTASELERMMNAKQPFTQVPIRSTASGTVLRREVRQGDYVKQGEVLFELSDLETVWVELDAYESDLDAIKVGQTVSLHLDALEVPERSGTVTFIDPVIDPKTRAASVRIEVENKDGAIKPGMYVSATLQASEVQPGAPLPLSIPASAPLFAGDRALVYVEVSTEEEGTTYEAREVVLGARVGEVYVVRAGLERGEQVVTHGAFVLDSDLQIRGSLSLMARADDMTRTEQNLPISLTAHEREQLRPVLSTYLDVGESLAEDNLQAVLTQTAAWRKALVSVDLKSSETKRVWDTWSRRLDADLAILASAKDLAQARTVFSHITGLFDEWLETFGNVLDEPIRKAFCPMARDNKGDHWYQRAEQVDNVYFGSQMRQCGEIRRRIGAGSTLLDVKTPTSPTPEQEHHHGD